MKSQQIASVIYSPQRHRNSSYPGYNDNYNNNGSSSSLSQSHSSYPYHRSNSVSFRMDSTSTSRIGDIADGGLGYTTGSGPYDDDFMDSQRGMLMRTPVDGAIEDVDLNKERFEREELKLLRDRDQKLRNALCVLRFTNRTLNIFLRLYDDTKDHKISSGRPGTPPYITAWPKKPYVRPIFVWVLV
ncbi:hypothetical protein TWF694_007503 [Orbilia ellipsospora]|uniref:Uncharacterized protein n=1 Tax=Orbilia ellipsospora TaxID=2528407 RepID=A0AAV9XIT5_9PEZI